MQEILDAKRVYSKPLLTTYGSVSRLTQSPQSNGGTFKHGNGSDAQRQKT